MDKEKSFCICCNKVESEFVCESCLTPKEERKEEKWICVNCGKEDFMSKMGTHKICDECFEEGWDKLLNEEIERHNRRLLFPK
ncbi:hypothetical protein [Bacillus swezeyi]|nr:hypothetical protein [Bacillus swezeyi]